LKKFKNELPPAKYWWYPLGGYASCRTKEVALVLQPYDALDFWHSC